VEEVALRRAEGVAAVSQSGYLLSRCGRSVPENVGGFDTHRDSISSRLDCSRRRRRGGSATAPSSSW
jgi:hypothetical protein